MLQARHARLNRSMLPLYYEGPLNSHKAVVQLVVVQVERLDAGQGGPIDSVNTITGTLDIDGTPVSVVPGTCGF
jgi:hypothetical protein